MKREKIFYGLGSAFLIFMGIGHFYGQFGPRGLDIRRSLIEEAMRGYTIQGFGYEYSLMDVTQCWGVFFGVLTVIFGLLNVFILIESLNPASMIRFSAFNILSLIVLMVAGALYVPFTAVGFSVVLLCYILSAFFFYKKKAERT